MFVVAVSAAAGVLAASPGPALAQPGGFGDVAEDSYYSVPVSALAERGVFFGTQCEAGFCPGEPIDRKTMAVWVVRILDGNDPAPVSESRFDDVGGWHARFIERMAELGVTAGCGDGTAFCPDLNVSRAQMAVFLSRAYELPDGPEPGFSDVPPDAWYAASVAKLAASQITAGCGDGTAFCPDRDTTRAQMATFLYRAENWVADSAAQQARADVEVNGHDDSINLHVTYDNDEYEATVRWSAPSGTHGQVEHYVLQSRLTLEDFGPGFYPLAADPSPVRGHDDPVPRNQIVESENSQNSYQVTVSNATNSNHLYAFRVITVYANGKRLATSEVKTPSNIHKLRDIIKDKVVEPNQDDQPWLGDTWIHMNDSTRFGMGFGAGSVSRGSEYPDPNGLVRTFASHFTVGRFVLQNQTTPYIAVIVEEMGHVYTLTNEINKNSASTGIGYLYVHLLAINHAVEAKKPTRCGASELIGDFANMVFWDRYSDFDAYWGLKNTKGDGVVMSEWRSCGFRLDDATKAKVNREIPEIAKSVFVDQETPRWFYDTYQKADGAIDLERLWSDITIDERYELTMSIIAYNLRNEFGGYCSEEQVREFIEGKATGITNPWKDGGCRDNVLMEEEEEAPAPTSTTGSSTGQTPDISELIRNGTYGSYTPLFLQRSNRPDRCWIAINNYLYDVTPGEDGYDYPGPGQITDLCGQDASDHFSANNLDYPPLRYLKGHLRSS